MEIRKRYSDEELKEFRAIINQKLGLARSTYEQMMRQLMNTDSHSDNDTAPTYKILEEGTDAAEKEQLISMVQRQHKFIQGLEAALVRIEKKTYGIDRLTGELILKERLRLVPHATLSVDSKKTRNH